MRWKGWNLRESALVFAFFLITSLILFWQVWTPGPAELDFAYGDFIEQYYPMRTFVAAEWRMGRAPLWDPFTFSGEPAAGASLFAPFYPLGLWHTLFPPPLPLKALEFDAILHLALAGLFTYLLVRKRTGDGMAGLLAGVAFASGGYLTSYPVLQLTILYTAIWLPLVLYLIELAIERRSLWLMTLPGVAMGVSILAGHPQIFLYLAYLSFPYLLFRVWHSKLGWRFMAAALLLMGGVAAGFGAAHWLPGLELLRLSPRAHLSYADVANGFTLSELWGIVRANYGEWSPLYIGVIAWVLAAGGVLFVRKAEVWFWAAVASVTLLLALGGNGFLFPLFYRFVPGFSFFRSQERLVYLFSFAMVMLAGFGFAAFRGWLSDRGFSGRSVRIISVIFIAALFFDLFLANNGLVLEKAPEQGYFPENAMVSYLHDVSLPDWRMSSEGLWPGDGNAALVYRLRDVVGSSPLHLERYDQFIETVPEVRWLAMLNVQHILTKRHLEHGALKLVQEEGDKRLYQAFLGGTPLWITHAYQIAENADAAIAATADPALDFKQVVVLEQTPDPIPSPLPDSSPAETAKLTHFEPQYIEAEVTLERPAVVVFSEIDYPGWRAFANGQEVAALRAFGVLRAVALPAGRWRIVWRYQPVVASLGIFVSVVTLVLAALAVILFYRRSRQASIRQ